MIQRLMKKLLTISIFQITEKKMLTLMPILASRKDLLQEIIISLWHTTKKGWPLIQQVTLGLILMLLKEFPINMGR